MRIMIQLYKLPFLNYSVSAESNSTTDTVHYSLQYPFASTTNWPVDLPDPNHGDLSSPYILSLSAVTSSADLHVAFQLRERNGKHRTVR